jgi:hypothetical protein
MMIPKVVDGKYVADYVIRIRFDDGREGNVDLRDELWGPIFEPLRDPLYFRRFRVHPELHTIVWENGADFSPEFLYSQIHPAA